jgi:hypothetical protein
MRKLIIFSGTVFLLSGWAVAQANGQATVVSGYATTGVYSMPIVPLVNTPSLTLGASSQQVEANEATADADVNETSTSSKSDGFNSGAARSQDSYGAAELASRFHPGKAAKVYTNQDVAQVNDTNGLVKFGNKTEHL